MAGVGVGEDIALFLNAPHHTIAHKWCRVELKDRHHLRCLV